MITYRVQLSEQDLADFLDDKPKWSEQYRAELERRLSQHGQAEVEISRNALLDKITIYSDNTDDLERIREEDEEKEFVGEIMNRMANEIDSWLKQD